jgi:hypothetical protein
VDNTRFSGSKIFENNACTNSKSST